MRKLIQALRRFWRILKWAIKSLWKRYPFPTIADGRKYPRNYLRKIYKPMLQDCDRKYTKTHDEHHLWNRRLLMARCGMEIILDAD